MTTSPRFEEPPPINRTQRHGNIPDDIVQMLRDNPGEWIVVREDAPSPGSAYATAFQIRRGLLTAFRPPGAYQARGRTVSGKYRVYARFIGSNGEFA